jgi:hypothetical protein
MTQRKAGGSNTARRNGLGNLYIFTFPPEFQRQNVKSALA